VGQVAATDDPDVARSEIEQTRARMSSTIDTIEEVLLRKKEKLQDRLDVMSPVRERPMLSVGAVFTGGLLLGLLTGGGSDGNGRAEAVYGEGVDGHDGHDAEWKELAHTWEGRARGLQKLARTQEEELRDLRKRMDRLEGTESHGLYAAGHGSGEESHGVGALGATLSHLREAAMETVAGVVGGLFGAGVEHHEPHEHGHHHHPPQLAHEQVYGLDPDRLPG
jgi:hypothetical protein